MSFFTIPLENGDIRTLRSLDIQSFRAPNVRQHHLAHVMPAREPRQRTPKGLLDGDAARRQVAWGDESGVISIHSNGYVCSSKAFYLRYSVFYISITIFYSS